MTELSTQDGTVSVHFDAYLNGRIMGWAQDSARPDHPVVMLLHIGDRRVSSHRADQFRPDLEEAGVGFGRHGFTIDVPQAILALAIESGGALHLRTAEKPDRTFITITIGETLSIPEPLRDLLRDRLDFSRLGLVVGPVPDKKDLVGIRSHRFSYQRLVEHSSEASKTPPTPILFPYAEHVRRVRQLESEFSPDEIDTDVDHFMRWYLDHYGVERAPRRAPLSRDVIRWLNEPITIGGQPFEATRVMLWYLADADCPHGLSSLADASRYRTLLYWWATERAPALNAEDCLVSPLQVEFLRQVPHEWSGRPFPLSNFAEEAVARGTGLSFFGSMQSESTRMTAYLTLFVEAIDAPGLLRFIPKAVVTRFFGPTEPLFDNLAKEVCANNPGAEPLTAARYRCILASRGFDLDTMQFLSVDSDGHRIEAARLGAVAKQPVVDVQLIGPFTKVSGVAQATRASGEALRKTLFTSAMTDFTMDNPQPEQAGASLSLTSGVEARINIIHLNADMLPLAYAYLPDLHRSAYTIGFFFWELDRPADCHRLAFDLVDEIWVASEYNRRCFAAWTEKPVINMGLAVTKPEVPPRLEARAALVQYIDVKPDDFVFFTTYDSLSYLSRKNPLGILRAFQDAFPNDDHAHLIIKTHNAAAATSGLSLKVWDTLLRAAAQDRRIKIINQTMSYVGLMTLKAGCDCYVSLHRSEGFGFGMMEAMSLRIPVVCTAYSGNLDFCDDASAWLVEADEVGVRFDDYAHVSPGHRWAEPRHDSAVAALREVRTDAVRRDERVGAAYARVAEVYSVDAASRRYGERLATILADRPPGAAGAGHLEDSLNDRDAKISIAKPSARKPGFLGRILR